MIGTVTWILTETKMEEIGLALQCPSQAIKIPVVTLGKGWVDEIIVDFLSYTQGITVTSKPNKVGCVWASYSMVGR